MGVPTAGGHRVRCVTFILQRGLEDSGHVPVGADCPGVGR